MYALPPDYVSLSWILCGVDSTVHLTPVPHAVFTHFHGLRSGVVFVHVVNDQQRHNMLLVLPRALNSVQVLSTNLKARAFFCTEFIEITFYFHGCPSIICEASNILFLLSMCMYVYFVHVRFENYAWLFIYLLFSHLTKTAVHLTCLWIAHYISVRDNSRVAGHMANLALSLNSHGLSSSLFSQSKLIAHWLPPPACYASRAGWGRYRQYIQPWHTTMYWWAMANQG